MKKEDMSKLRSIISIYAYDDIKQIIVMALNAEQPLHILLTGESGCGKTQFLKILKAITKIKRILLLEHILQRQECWIICLRSVQECF
jgi:energy-coupling factor transporter ATP-binding protein EcfA2